MAVYASLVTFSNQSLHLTEKLTWDIFIPDWPNSTLFIQISAVKQTWDIFKFN